MAKRKLAKRGKKKRSLNVKKKFANAMFRMRKMKRGRQRTLVQGASNEFIRDVSSFLTRVRRRPDLVKGSHRKVLRRHKKKLQRLIHAKTPIKKKRQILIQKGGIIPALIPIICAVIGAGGAVGAGAASAAIMKS